MGSVRAVHEYMTNRPPMDTVDVTGCRSVVPTPWGASTTDPTGSWALSAVTPVVVTSGSRAYDAETQRRLWEVSEELTGVRFPFERTARHHQEAPKGEPS